MAGSRWGSHHRHAPQSGQPTSCQRPSVQSKDEVEDASRSRSADSSRGRPRPARARARRPGRSPTAGSAGSAAGCPVTATREPVSTQCATTARTFHNRPRHRNWSGPSTASPRRTSTGSSYRLIAPPRRSSTPRPTRVEVGVEVTATRVASNICSNTPRYTPHRQPVKSAGAEGRRVRSDRAQVGGGSRAATGRRGATRPSTMTSAESTTKTPAGGGRGRRADQHADASGGGEHQPGPAVAAEEERAEHHGEQQRSRRSDDQASGHEPRHARARLAARRCRPARGSPGPTSCPRPRPGCTSSRCSQISSGDHPRGGHDQCPALACVVHRSGHRRAPSITPCGSSLSSLGSHHVDRAPIHHLISRRAHPARRHG